MIGADLFDFDTRYPHRPGFREKGGTSQAAAEEMAQSAPRLRERVMACLRQRGPMTPDECAAAMGADILSIRPRFTEIARLGAISKTGVRRPNRSGSMAAEWMLVQ